MILEREMSIATCILNYDTLSGNLRNSQKRYSSSQINLTTEVNGYKFIIII